MRRTLALVILALALGLRAASAQSSAAAELAIVVTDQAGGALPGAAIVVTNTETGLERQAITDVEGRYRLAALPTGTYTLRVTMAGFATDTRQGLVLSVGQVATLTIALKPAVSEQVSVTAELPLVDTAQTQVGTVVSRDEIENLPINGRNFLDFSRTVAGVTDQGVSGQGSGLSFNGQRGRSNNISVDGADNNGQLNGNVRLTLSQEAVREFQVVTNQFAPEFGRAGGGLVNVVSKSGTNDLRGSAFVYLRDEAFDARNAFVLDEEKPPFERQNFGGAAGGPIRRNRTFYFGAVERIDRKESDVVTVPDDAIATINATLAARPVPNGGVTSVSNGTFPIDIETTLASLKVDHQWTSNDALMVRYMYGRTIEVNAGGVGIGQQIDLSGGGALRGRDQSVLASWTRVMSGSLLSETRVQISPRSLTQLANDPIGPRITISGVATFGRNTNFPVLLDETRYQVQQTFSLQRRRHFFKFGTDLQRLNAHTSFPSNFGGSFTFGSLANFVAGTPTTFSQGFGNPEIELPDTLLGFYAQDSWTVRDRLTLVYGLRYDYDLQPQGIPRDRNNPIEAPLQDGVARDGNNVAPRVAATYDLTGKGRTVIRAGYGVFYDKLFLLVGRNALLARQSISLSGAAARTQFAQGAFPESDRLPAGFTLANPNITLTDEHLSMPYAHQVNAGLEHQIGRFWAVGANYIHVRGEALLRTDNVNLGPPTVLTVENAASLGVANPTAQQIGRPYFGTTNRLDRAFNNIQLTSATGRSRYHGVQLLAEQRLRKGVQFRANYTLGEAKDDGADFVQAEQPSNPYNRAAEFGLATEHVRHRFSLTALWVLPFKDDAAARSLSTALLGGWRLSSVWELRSGRPRNIDVGSDVNADGNAGPDRPFVNGVEVGRNTFDGPGRQVVDVRLAKRFGLGDRRRLLVQIDAFNLFNRVNYLGVNTTWGTALAARDTFGRFESAADPRQLQFGLKLEF